jgi:hypothetical protein
VIRLGRSENVRRTTEISTWESCRFVEVSAHHKQAASRTSTERDFVKDMMVFKGEGPAKIFINARTVCDYASEGLSPSEVTFDSAEAV